ncbi:MAG TPA: ABC transporter substrate-binding protein [Solirubrobacteraceae bacterium]|nr:ABC transporter substrate-binding protein [Solirubrobacteraceae bacterium]
MSRKIWLGFFTILLLAGALLACGEDDGVKESEILGTSLTIYSSLPLQGPLAPVSRDIVRAEKLAIREAGGRAGAYDIGFVSLDSADPETGRWSPGQVAGNARKAVQDRQAIAYLGELDSGASAVSVPILNEGGLLQVSPRDTYAGLTEPGGRGEPDKYYPSSRRTFARVVPADDQQVQDLIADMTSHNVERLILADDREVAGVSMGDRVAQAARDAGIEVVDRRRLDPGGDVPEDLGEELRQERGDAFFYAGTYSDFAVDVLREVHDGAPAMRLYGADDLAMGPQLPERLGTAARRLMLTGVDPAPGADEAFERSFQRVYGEKPERQAILGYRAMKLVLSAIGRAGERAKSRRTVIDLTLRMAGEPRARFTRYRISGDRLVRVRDAL